MSYIDHNEEERNPTPTEKEMETTRKCPDCGAEDDDIGYENEEHFCKKCGRVID